MHKDVVPSRSPDRSRTFSVRIRGARLRGPYVKPRTEPTCLPSNNKSNRESFVCSLAMFSFPASFS
jgi:hypothetical protein